MYIRVNKSGNFHQVYVVETKRNGKKTSTHIVAKLGKLEDLTKNNPNALEELKAKYSQAKVQAAVNNQKFIDKVNEAVNNQTYFSKSAPLLNYGLEPLRQIWNNDLKLDYRLNYLKKSKSKIQFDFEAIIRYMVGMKVLDPRSIVSTFDARTSFFGNDLKDASIYDFYRALDFLQANKDCIINHLNKQIEGIVDRSYSMVFYDVTNTYFEANLTDEEKDKINDEYLDEVIQLVKKYHQEVTQDDIWVNEEGFVPDAEGNPIDYYYFDEEGNIIYDNLPRDLYKQIKGFIYFKMRGLSKEHRYDLPLISIALVIDEYGLPIDYEVFSGCRSEYKTMTEAIDKIKNKYHVENTIVVADRGLNSVSNLDMLLKHNYGFLVAQKVSNLGDDIRSQMLDKEGYQTLEGIPEEQYRYKIVDDFIKVDKKKKLKVPCKIVFSFSQERYERDMKQLEADVAKAEDAIKNKLPIFKNTRNWQSVLIIPNKNECKAIALNDDLIAKRTAECGYSAVVYSCAPNSTNDLTGKEIAASYHRLVKIEECFRIMKSNLGLRPVFVSTPEHIKGHCMICYLALVLIRLLELKLDKNEHHMSIEQISDALMSGKLAVSKTNGEAIFTNTLEIKGLYKDVIFKDKEKTKEEVIEEIKKKKPDIETIMEVCGLTPVSLHNTTQNINKCFKRKFRGLKEMVDKMILDIM